MSFDTDVFTSSKSAFDPEVFKSGRGVATIPGTPEQPKPGPEPSFWDQAKGVGEAGLSVLSGIPAGLWAGVVALSHGLKPGNYGTPQGTRAYEDAFNASMKANTYAPRTEAGKEALDTFGKATQSLPALTGFPNEMNIISTLTKPALSQAKNSTLNALTPKIDPEVVKLAQTAEKYDIPLRPDMLGKNRFAKVFGNFAETDVPLSGSRGPQRENAFVNAVVRQIDPESQATRLTPDVYSSAMEKSGRTIGDIAARTPVDATGLNSSVKAVVSNARPYGNDTHLLVSARAKDLRSLIKDGMIDGTEFKQWNSKVLQDMRNANDITQASLGSLQEVAMAAFEKSLAPEDIPVWKSARQQYAIGKQLLPMVAKSPTGEISPAGLMAVVNRGKDAQSRMAYGSAGDIGELAKLGTQFMKEPGGQTLPERVATYGLLGGLGSGLLGGSGMAAAGATYGASGLYNLLGPSAVKSIIKRRAALLGEAGLLKE